MCVCVCVTSNSRSAYNLNQSVVEMIPSFVKLVSPFRKPINQLAFLVKLVVSLMLHIYTSEEFLGCMVVVEMPGM